MADFSIFTSIRYDPILSSSLENDRLCNRRKCRLYMPELHRQRLWKASCKFWPSLKFKELETTASFETALLAAIEERERLHETYMCPMKVKYTFWATGRTTLELSPVPALSMEALFPSTLKLPSETRPASPGARKFSVASLSSNGGSFTTGPDDYLTQPTPPSAQESSLQATYEIFIDTEPTKQSSHTTFKTTYRPHYNAARARALPYPNDFTLEVLLWNPAGQITEASITTPYFWRRGRWITPAVDFEDHGGQQGTTRRWALGQGLCKEGIVERKSVREGERVWLSNGARGFGWGRIVKVKK